MPRNEDISQGPSCVTGVLVTRTVRSGSHAALVLACSAAPGLSAECLFERAIYTQKESGYVLRFAPSRELARFSGTTNTFFVEAKDLPKPLTGWVIWNNGESRPEGSAMLDCPQDADTDEDLADCTKWSGVIYALGEGDAALLPGEDQPPPATILLPDFGRQIHYSIILDIGSEEVPWDVFRFDRCDG